MSYEELYNKLKKLENFIEENKNTNPRLTVENIKDLQEYYKSIRPYLLSILEDHSYTTIKRVVEQHKIEMAPNTKLIEDSSYREQNALISMFNKDLSEGKFSESLMGNGIFLPSSRGKHVGSKHLFLNPSIGRPNYGIMYFKFLYNKNAIVNNSRLNPNIRSLLSDYLVQKDFISANEYTLIKEFFQSTAPFVLNNLITKFEEAYLEAKRENTPIILSTPFVNIENNISVVILLETLYNELLRQEVFKGTIFEKATTDITKGNAKFLNELLMSPLEEKIATKKYSLRFVINSYDIEKR